MASDGELGRTTDTVVFNVLSQVRLQEFADKVVQAKVNVIRKRCGDQHLQVSCKYHVLVLC